ncbi:MAG: cell division topological specificity factor MinE [Deltaproteobacteria bacterium]
MSIFDFFRKPKSADIAKERLMVVLSYERKDLPTDFTQRVRQDLVNVFGKYPQFNLDNIEVNVKTGLTRDELSISIPFNKDGR